VSCFDHGSFRRSAPIEVERAAPVQVDNTTLGQTSRTKFAQQREPSQPEQPFIRLGLTTQNVLVTVFTASRRLINEDSMKKIAFVLAALAAIVFALPVATAEAGGMDHHYHHHHHHHWHR
jgi:hypothetical protein